MAKEIPTVSSIINEKSRALKLRHSLQPKPHTAKSEDNRPRSHSYSHRTSKQIEKHVRTISTIPESEFAEEEVEIETVQNSQMGQNVNASYSKHKQDRKTSQTSQISGLSNKRKTSSIKGYDNSGFEDYGHESQQSPTIKGHYPTFHRAYTESTRSSTYESGHSLVVQREQYCCCKKWSPCERRLATAVGILAAIIVILVIAVGVLASPTEGRKKFYWSF